jgi:hypothetical protein
MVLLSGFPSDNLDFIGKPRKTQQMSLRSIIIDEDEKAVFNPETHSQGLISFCKANPHLRIERRVGIWHHIFTFRWGAGQYHSWWREKSFSAECFLVPIVE